MSFPPTCFYIITILSGLAICSSLVLDEITTSEPNAVVAYFDFDFRIPAKRNITGLLSSLVFQLADGSEKCLALLKAARSISHIQPSDSILVKLLKDMLRQSGRTFILADALDECDEAARKTDLLPLITEVMGLGSDICVFVTSRPERDIRDHITPLSMYTLNLHRNSQHQETIASYIISQLSTAEYETWSDAVRKKATEVLGSKSEGM